MNQKLIKTSTPSNSTMAIKNKIIGFDQILHNSSSQPVSTDSPFNRQGLETRSNSLKNIYAKKVSHGKLAFLLETHNNTTKRATLFPKQTESDSKIFDKELQTGQKYCIGTQIVNAEKETQPKIRLNLDPMNLSMGVLIHDAHNKETQRPRKYKKTHKFSTGGKDNQLHIHHLSHNISHSTDNSLFISGLATTTHAHRAPSNSPKISLLNTLQSQFTDFVCSSPNKKTSRPKKNPCFSESVSLEPGKKTYLNHNASSYNWKQCHRKIGSNSTTGGSSNVIRKSFSKMEQLKNLIPQGSPKNSHSKIFGFQNTLRSSSRETVKKGIDMGQLNTLRVNFDSLIGSYGTQIADAQANQELLKKIKQEYEAVIEGLIRDKEVYNDNQALLEENARLRAEIDMLKADQGKIRESDKNTQEFRLSSPCQSGMPTEKRMPSLKCVDSPPLTKNGKRGNKFEKENEKLKQILMRQQGTISTLRKKENKMLKLIYAIKKRDVDVERIYNEDVKGKSECVIPDDIIPTLDKLKVTDRTESEVQENTQREENKEDSIMQGSEDELEYDCIDLKPANNLQVPKGNLNPMLKDKLKLDFTALNQAGGEKRNLNNQTSGEPVGFHEEFMSKFEEFSLSWRQETMLQKNP